MTPQQTIAHYRIIGKLGKGGMGEVYSATDTKLGRAVAIKVIPEAFAGDPERLARFTREAQVLASLNHPNIAAIFGVEDRALILELVEGPTLADRIAAGPIPLDEAIPLARQMADALEYAHDRGVVHRDLKPANVKITPEGRVKVLDFGLAKALTAEATPGDPASSPTLTMSATMAGTILGTAAYMAPEQARGHVVDRRADIWAFGVVLYEMLTGRQLFGGPTVSDTLAGVLQGGIDLSAVPAQARPVLEHCLRREQRERWRCIGDAASALDEKPSSTPQLAAARSGARPWIAAAVLGVLALAAATGWWHSSRPIDHPLTRLNVDLGPDVIPGPEWTIAISPDGRRLVYPVRDREGHQQLATRLLDQPQPTVLAGTANGHDPFFSPDGQWIAYFDGGSLKKIAVEGGNPQTICPVGQARGGSWGDDGNIVLASSPTGGLSSVSAGGGKAQNLVKMDSDQLAQRWPQVLPGGDMILFTSNRLVVGQSGASVRGFSRKTGKSTILIRDGYYGRYLAGGHLAFIRAGALYVVRLNLEHLSVESTPRALAADVAADSDGRGQFAFSSDASGTLVYLAGKTANPTWQIKWFDGSGDKGLAIPFAGAYVAPSLSPEGTKLAFTRDADIFVYDMGRETTSRLTSTGNSLGPVWAPDGKHLVFGASDGLWWTRGDGAMEPQHLLGGGSRFPSSFAPDGRVAYFEAREDGAHVFTLSLDLTDPDHPKPGKPELYESGPGDQRFPKFSPDGRWMAYRSAETGQDDIYVRPFPLSRGGKWQISTAGAFYPAWSKNSQQLFFEDRDRRMWVLDYTVNGDVFVPGKPRLWSDKQLYRPTPSPNFEVAPDGKRLLVLSELSETEPKPAPHITMMFNVLDELRRTAAR